MKEKFEPSAFSNFTKFESLSSIIPGDIFVLLKYTVPLEPSENLHKKLHPEHGLIALGHNLGANFKHNKTLIHSTPRIYQFDDFAKYGKPCAPIYSEDGSPNIKYGNLFHGVQVSASHAADKVLGRVLILRCSDVELTKNIQKFILIYKNFKTPFAKAGTRRIDQPKEKGHLRSLEFFRAFRAFVRLSQEQAQPISKLKGLSCSNFVSYIYKAALLANLFPKGLPTELMTIFNQIEDERKQTYGKKLDSVNPKLLKLFEKKALAYLNQDLSSKAQPEAKNESESLEKSKFNLYLKELQRPVKNASINEFTENALQSPLWYAGVYCRDKETGQDFIMSYETYQKVHTSSSTHTNSVLDLSELIDKPELRL